MEFIVVYVAVKRFKPNVYFRKPKTLATTTKNVVSNNCSKCVRKMYSACGEIASRVNIGSTVVGQQLKPR